MSDLTRPHGSRFRDALAIVNPGACNPSGIAHSIVDACREIREHEPAGSAAQDPAVRLLGLSACVGLRRLLEGYMADEGTCSVGKVPSLKIALLRSGMLLTPRTPQLLPKSSAHLPPSASASYARPRVTAIMPIA
jgi:hypothetical protein